VSKIPLAKGEKLLTFKNKINGIVYYSTTQYKPVVRDGQEFLPVFQRPAPVNARQILLIAKSALEKCPNVSA
jgi:phosphoenolpyruvate carboxylase